MTMRVFDFASLRSLSLARYLIW